VFALPRSSWDDYDREAISAGGGVWPRTAKSVPVGPEIRAALGIDDGVGGWGDSAQPAGADPGGPAGPDGPVVERWDRHYVKASEETHADAGDKANDAIRADASELRVKVVGEGGKLGADPAGSDRVRP
jgi:glutamate dehydrogenase